MKYKVTNCGLMEHAKMKIRAYTFGEIRMFAS
jgi:hypothetical protein